MRYVIFGESHGPAIGVVLEGVPAGLELDLERVSDEMARRAAAMEGTVISTGGGIILRPENMEILSATGTVYFLDRDPRDIPSTTVDETVDSVLALVRRGQDVR